MSGILGFHVPDMRYMSGISIFWIPDIIEKYGTMKSRVPDFSGFSGLTISQVPDINIEAVTQNSKNSGHLEKCRDSKRRRRPSRFGFMAALRSYPARGPDKGLEVSIRFLATPGHESVILPSVGASTLKRRQATTSKEGTMGDKGGRKDKEKGQKQNASKQKSEAKIKADKQPKKKP